MQTRTAPVSRITESRNGPLSDLACSPTCAAFVARTINRHYLRSQAVAKLFGDEKTQKEAISGGLLRPLHQGMRQRVIPDLKSDIMNRHVEYRKNIKALGTVSLDHPWTLIGRPPFNISDLLRSTLYELPLVGQFLLCHSFSECLLDNVSVDCATTSRGFLSRLFGHSSVRLITKQSSRCSSFIRGMSDSYTTLSSLLSESGFVGPIQRIRYFYELLELQPSLKDGHLSYPDDEKRGHKDSLGMEIQFK